MDIRPYSPNDEASVIALWQACGLTVPQNNPQQDIARKLKVDPDLFIVGVLDNRIVASVMGGYEGHRGWINYQAVHPDHQRKGYGTQIMQAVEALLQQKDCPKINLQVRASNQAMIAFYAAMGYGDDEVIGLGKRLVEDESWQG